MPQQCPRCQRTLPDKAVYCAFDGAGLRAGGGQAVAGQLHQEFFFPSGRRCRTYDELAQGCHAEWEEAKQLLREGTFANFLNGIGRADLARLAREAQSMPDADRALTSFVSGLPASAGQGPKLGLSPRRLVVGPIYVGEQKPVQVTVQNEGRGQLQGTLTVAEGAPWLVVLDGDGPGQATVKTGREQVVRLLVNTQALNANQNYSGKLVAVTNGGVAELPVRLDLVPRPFSRHPYAGAANPRDLARRFRDNPKPAVELFENGEIARWFASNGWAYPIIGEPAPGVAAVQQYFEELGLARAPQVMLGQDEFRFQATPTSRCAFQIALRSPARKLVYARAECSVPWLQLGSTSVAGQGQASFEVEVQTAYLTEDREYPAVVKVVANAGQTFLVKVRVSMSGNRQQWFTSPAAGPAPPPPPPTPVAPPPAAPQASWAPPPAPQPTWAPAPVQASPPVHAVPTFTTTRPALPPPPPAAVPAEPGFGAGQAILAGTILGLLWRLVLLFPADVFARLVGDATVEGPGTLQMWLQAPSPDQSRFLRLFVLATWWVGALVGGVISGRKGGGALDVLCGIVAGAVAGLAASATVGCVLVLGDEVPRLLLRAVASPSASAALATTLWMCLAVVSWAGVGAAAGLVLYLLGELGHSVLALAGAPLAWGLRVVGLDGVAKLFEAG